MDTSMARMASLSLHAAAPAAEAADVQVRYECAIGSEDEAMVCAEVCSGMSETCL